MDFVGYREWREKSTSKNPSDGVMRIPTATAGGGDFGRRLNPAALGSRQQVCRPADKRWIPSPDVTACSFPYAGSRLDNAWLRDTTDGMLRRVFGSVGRKDWIFLGFPGRCTEVCRTKHGKPSCVPWPVPSNTCADRAHPGVGNQQDPWWSRRLHPPRLLTTGAIWPTATMCTMVCRPRSEGERAVSKIEMSTPPPQKGTSMMDQGAGRGNRREYQGILPMANGLRAGKVPALHGGAHATNDRTAEERTPGPWTTDMQDRHDGQDERTCSVHLDPVVNVNSAGMARRNPASQLCSGSSEKSHSQTPGLRTRCIVPRPRREGREGQRERICGGSLGAQQTKQRSPCLIPAWPPPKPASHRSNGDRPSQPDDRQQSRQPRLPRRKSASDRPTHARGDGGKHDPRISQQSHSLEAGMSSWGVRWAARQINSCSYVYLVSGPAEGKDPAVGEEAKIKIRKRKPSLR